DSNDGQRGPNSDREGAPLRASFPEQRCNQQRRQRRITGERILDRELKNRFRRLQSDNVSKERDENDKETSGLYLHRFAEAALTAVEGEDVLREHGRE